MKSANVTASLLAVALVFTLNVRAFADPLSGEVLKFQQLPLNNGLGPSAGGAAYPGHDEWSTATTISPAGYQGDFMADDFSDTQNTPVFHVRWWGSYDQNQNFSGVQKFLISFESDTFDPSLGPNGASRPDQVLSSEIVTLGALTPGSGTFTESLINGNVPEHLYQYNAELAAPFAEQANTVYWLKIVALVNPATDGSIKWGWHDRDWSLTNGMFAPVSPGEHIEGTVTTSAGTVPVWHFQDDAVQGHVLITPNTAGTLLVQQSNYTPQNYLTVAGAPLIDGPPGIENYSKDLAFELYTRPTSEPGTLALLGIGTVGLGVMHRRRRSTKRTARGYRGAAMHIVRRLLPVLKASHSRSPAGVPRGETVEKRSTFFSRRSAMKSANITAAVLAAALVLTLNVRAFADPLSGEVLKFQQLPLNNGLAPSTGGAPYPGHDEWSTAVDQGVVPPLYTGTFMADDFSDTQNTPIYHISWWGSYDQNLNLSLGGAQKFLISFESDMPSDPNLGGASRPDQVLASEIVTLGALAPGSGTFTETLANGAVQEHLYKYNAELAVPFAEQANTVYWLKIVALVSPTAQGTLNWGWHDRDWSLTNGLFAPVSPGERVLGTVPDASGQPVPVWHFQDDAVAGRVQVTQNTAGSVLVQQAQYQPQNYIYQVPGAIGVDGPQGIQAFSKDLAFELYTRPTPEPGTLALLGMGAVGLGLMQWRRRRMK